MALETRIEIGTAKQSIDKLEGFDVDEGKELLKVDLACGQRKKEGFKGLDAMPVEGADYIHNLMEFPWPFEDESVYEFNCEHYVEHIPIQLLDGTYGMHRFMEEVYRCLMPGGTIRIAAPYFMSEQAFQDPTHTRGITDRSFVYYNQDVVKGALDHYLPKCNFIEISKTKVIDPAFEGKGEVARRWAIQHYWNVVIEVQYTLRKKPLLVKEKA